MSLAQSGPSNINISGGLFSSSGTPITAASVNFRIELYDKTGSCLLYTENHLGVDLSETKGSFALEIGKGSSISNLIDTVSPTAMTSKVYENVGAIAGGWTGCTGGATLANGDERLIRVHYDLGSGYVTMTPDVPMASAAYSMVAETLQGKRPADFLQVKDDVPTDLSQANLENIFSATNYTRLNALVSGSSTQYMVTNPAAAVDFNNQRITGVATPTAATDAASKGYSDGYIGGKVADTSTVGPATGNGHTLIWDQATQKWITGVPVATDNTKLPLAGGTMTGAIDMGGFNITNTGHITMAAQRTLTFGTVNNAQETALIATLLPANAGATWYNSQTKILKVWDGTAAVAQVYSVNGKTGGAITLNANDLGLGTAALENVGTTAGDVPQLDAGGKIPAALLPASTLTWADVLNGATKYMNYRPNDVACANNEVLKYDLTNTRWICGTDNDTFSGSTAGGDLTGTYPNPTIAANAVSTPKLFTNPGVNRLVATDGSTGATLAPFECTANQIMQWGGTGWACQNVSAVLGTGYIIDGGNARGTAISIGTNDNFGLNFRTNNANRMTLSSTGSLGIGTATPASRLHVDQGDVTLRSYFNGTSTHGFLSQKAAGTVGAPTAVANNDSLGFYMGMGYDGANYQTASYLNMGVDGTVATGVVPGKVEIWVADAAGVASPRFTVRSSGNVGIGTNNPGRLLHVNGPIRIAPAALPGTPAAGDLALDSGAANALKFYDGSAWQTVGTGTGSGDFLRNGSLAMTGNFNAGGNSVLGNTTASANLNLESTSNVTKGFVNLQPNGGNVGIGTTTPASALDVNGTISLHGVNGLWQNNTNRNLAIGNNNFPTLSTSSDGIAIGHGALNSTNAATTLGNVAVGVSALGGTTAASSAYITALGYRAGRNAGNGGSIVNYSVFIGSSAGENAGAGGASGQASNSVMIGLSAGQGAGGGGGNSSDTVIIGGNAGQDAGNGNGNIRRSIILGKDAGGYMGRFGSAQESVVIGYQAGYRAGDTGTAANNNVLIGSSAGFSLASSGGLTANDNIMIGYGAGYNGGTGASTSGSGNILIGKNVVTPAVSTSNFLNIGNAVYGDLATGNVGIGTNSPARKLHVNGPMRVTPAALPGTPAAGDLAFDSGASNALKFYDGSAWQTVGTGSGAGDFMKNGSVSMTGNLNAGNNQVMNVSAVGIGTTTPDQPLHIVKSTGTDALIHLFNSNSSTTWYTGMAANNYIIAQNTSTPILTVENNTGRVGIGTSNATPAGTLSVYDASAGTGVTRLHVREGAGQSANESFGVYANNNTTPRLVVNGGNVGVGTATPNMRANTGVTQSMYTGGGNPSTLELIGGSAQGAPVGSIYFMQTGFENGIYDGFIRGIRSPSGSNGNISVSIGHGTTDQVVVDQGGQVGIGTLAPARLLHVNGPIRITPAALPGTPAAGELAFDSSASNALKYHNGSAWVGVGSGNGDFLRDGSLAMTGNFNSGGFKLLGNTTASANLTLESTTNATKGYVNIQPAGGFVGIGTTTPAGVLDVRGGTAAAGNGTSVNIYAQNAFASGNTNGGNIILMPGAKNGTGAVGAVGINTASPTAGYNVDVAGSIRTQTLAFATTGGPNFSVGSGYVHYVTNGTNTGIVMTATGNVNYSGADTGSPFSIGFSSDSVSKRYVVGLNSSGNPIFKSAVPDSATAVSHLMDTQTSITNPSALLLSMRNAGTEKMNVNYDGGAYFNGNVGVGTSAPTAKLEVNGVIKSSSGGITFPDGTTLTTASIPAGVGTTSTTDLNFSADSDADLSGDIMFTTQNIERVRVTNAGKVGIGVGSPLSPLDVSGGMTVGTYAGVQAAPANGLAVSGNVGIGTSSPNAALQVLTNASASSPALRLDGLWFSGGTGTTTKPHLLIEPTGTTATNWHTGGTAIGVNAPNGFGGYLAHLQINGQSKFIVTGNDILMHHGASYFTSMNGPWNIRGTAATGYGINLFANSAVTSTVNGSDNGLVKSTGTFTTASGSATFNGLQQSDTINQTGTATGVTRGVYINPVLTSAADFRGLETAAYTQNLVGTPPTTIRQIAFNAPTLAAGSAATVTNAATQIISGAPVAGSNVTITNPYAFWIQGGNSRFDGNVGIGTSTPTAALDVNGNAKFRGGVNGAIRVVTAAGAITVTTSDYVVCVNKAAGAATIVNLPASPTTGDMYVVKDCKGDAAANNITITPNAGNIDGAGTKVINTNRAVVTVIYDGTGWQSI